jgi:hypothetical protein
VFVPDEDKIDRSEPCWPGQEEAETLAWAAVAVVDPLEAVEDRSTVSEGGLKMPASRVTPWATHGIVRHFVVHPSALAVAGHRERRMRSSRATGKSEETGMMYFGAIDCRYFAVPFPWPVEGRRRGFNSRPACPTVEESVGPT